MIISLLGNKTIDISLTNGFWVFDSDSGTGKSYLCENLLAYISLGNSDVRVFGQPMIEETDVVISEILSGKYKLIVMDRLDIYFNSKIEEAISKVENECIIIADLKTLCTLRLTSPRDVEINFDLDGFRVYEDNDV